MAYRCSCPGQPKRRVDRWGRAGSAFRLGGRLLRIVGTVVGTINLWDRLM